MVKKFTEWKMLSFQTKSDERSLYMHLVKELNEFYDYVNSYINLGSEVQFLDLPKLSDDIKDLKEQFEELKKKPSSSGNVDLTEINDRLKNLEEGSLNRKDIDTTDLEDKLKKYIDGFFDKDNTKY